MDEQARYLWIAAHVLPYEGEVRGWLRHHVRAIDAFDVDDLIQEAYSRLWVVDFSRILNGRSYFYTIVRNLVVEQVRRARVLPMETMGELEALHIISNEPGPERRVSASQEVERLQRAVADLPPKCRQAFQLQKFEGLSQRAIALRMQIAEKTVEKHLAKALARVVEAMTKEREAVSEVAAIRKDMRHGTDT